ncbi:MAG TPA: DUF3352 domain-containing protein [Solirubrobacteraceae bacterium]|nr:DUF3352 domain-containing protein [Solirubrobacteraceae bacterium]
MPEPSAPIPTRRRRKRLAPPAVALLAILAVGLPGCGSSSHSDGTEADPATAVPAAAPVYVGVTVRPGGSLRTGVLAAGRAFGASEATFAGLAELLRTPGSPALDYKRDLAPWLGPHAGLFLQSTAGAETLAAPLLGAFTSRRAPSFPAGRLDGALVIDTSDASAARSFLAGQAKRAGAHAASYRGVSYEVGGGVAFGLVGRFAVIGSEAGMRAAIGATQGEASLSSSGAYAKLAAAAPAGAIGHLYANIAAGSATGTAGGLLAVLGSGRPVDVSLLAAAGSLTLDVDSLARPGTRPGLLSADPEGASALGELPGSSWLAIGLGHAGANLSADVAGLRAAGTLLGGGAGGEGSTLSLGSVLSGLTAPLSVLAAPGAAAQRDYRSWMGSAGIFASGSSVLELKGAVVIASSDPARSRAAVAKLGAALRHKGLQVAPASIAGTEAALGARLPGLPLELDIAAGPGSSGSKFVLGLGPASVQEALSPSETLAAAPSRSAAASALGEGTAPSLAADVPTLLALLESVGLTEDPSLKSTLPYLRATTTVAGGGRSLGGELERVKLVLGLKQSGQSGS